MPDSGTSFGGQWPSLLLVASDNALSLARELIREGRVPEKAATDAAHVPLATVHGVEYLLTWNCTHIVNAEMRTGIERVCRVRGLEPPVLCTPEELMGEPHVQG